MTNKPSPLKNWLITSSVALGVSGGFTLLFTQNLAQSALIGLATIPGVAASGIVRSRQRQRQLERQLERGKLRLQHLQQREEVLNRQIHVRGKDCQAIELRTSQLHSLAASLTDRTDRHQHAIKQLEQQLAALTLYCEDRQAVATKLDRKIQDKQVRNLELATNFNQLKLKLSELQAEQVQIQATNNRAIVIRSDIQAEIDRSQKIKLELAQQIETLQCQEVITTDLDDTIRQQKLALSELDLAIRSRQKIHQTTSTEVDLLTQSIAKLSPEIISQEQKLSDILAQSAELELSLASNRLQSEQLELEIFNKTSSLELHNREFEITQLESRNSITAEIELALQVKQEELDELELKLIDKYDELDLYNRELKTAQLELSSRQAELDNLEFKIHTKRQTIDELDLSQTIQVFDPKPPVIAREIELNVLEGEWHDKFIDNPHLIVLQHIEKHGTITEAEASSKLGNARSVRQFANKLAEYTPDLPFSIRVESSPKGNRYLKETQN